MATQPNMAADKGTAVVDSPCDEVAAMEVFTMPELMEKILESLTTRELFGVRRAHRTFDRSIEGSPKLQRKMFLQTSDADESSDFTMDADPRLNPLLQEFVFLKDEGGSQGHFQFHEYTTELARSRKSGPLTLDRKLKISYYNYKVEPRGAAVRREAGGKSAAKQESWRRTLVTKANAATVEAKVRLVLDTRRPVVFDKTVTLGDLVEKS
ncbi:hypothetical protein PRZ48_012092 [Zasmidium cellare]|uniref:F-box domain-containing protein n=1 Tax=Zasmidium cellare TaxID=395010 RepID=A0ABR0E3W6_ZASCE|nr:hypothetical protein PRZ48_012092 [Zasmidium cellare]